MKRIKFILKYLKHFLSAHSLDDIHSPFVFKLTTEVIRAKTTFHEFESIENIRKKLLKKSQLIDTQNSNQIIKKKISYIAKHSAKSSKQAQFLFRLIKYFQPTSMIEIGTSLGISAMHQAMAAPQIKLTTIEGNPQLIKIANENFHELGLKNIELINGNFDIVLPNIVTTINQADYVFFDGNHQKDATINYFNLFLNKTHNDTIFIFDDIHWSDGMEEAWEIIKSNNQVTVTIDLFFMGIVFFNKQLSKENFKIKF